MTPSSIAANVSAAKWAPPRAVAGGREVRSDSRRDDAGTAFRLRPLLRVGPVVIGQSLVQDAGFGPLSSTQPACQRRSSAPSSRRTG
jgi:hypothetical protein